MARVQVTFDAADPAALAGFWKQVLGYIEEPPPEGWSSWEDWAREQGIPEERWNDQSGDRRPGRRRSADLLPAGPGGKTAKNRVHLDVRAAPGLDPDARVDALTEESDAAHRAGRDEALRVRGARLRSGSRCRIRKATSSAWTDAARTIVRVSNSDELFARASNVIPGGVDSPVRAFGAVGGTPRFIERGEGAYLVDVDGDRYVDYVQSWGALLFGHARPEIVGQPRRRPRAAHRSAHRRQARSSSPSGSWRRCRASTWCAWSRRAPRRR